jgi:hypothetical protein
MQTLRSSDYGSATAQCQVARSSARPGGPARPWLPSARCATKKATSGDPGLSADSRAAGYCFTRQECWHGKTDSRLQLLPEAAAAWRAGRAEERRRAAGQLSQADVCWGIFRLEQVGPAICTRKSRLVGARVCRSRTCWITPSHRSTQQALSLLSAAERGKRRQGLRTLVHQTRRAGLVEKGKAEEG